jgi:hypothetical protein
MANEIGTLATANDVVDVGSTQSDVQLFAINVSTAAASAVVTVYEGDSTSGTVKDTIDAASKGTTHYYGALFRNGLFVKLTGGNAKVSVVYG